MKKLCGLSFSGYIGWKHQVFSLFLFSFARTIYTSNEGFILSFIPIKSCLIAHIIQKDDFFGF